MDLAAKITEVLQREVQPLLGMDGLTIELAGIEGRTARLRISGDCTNFPGTILAVVMQIEQELRQRLPEIEYVEVVP